MNILLTSTGRRGYMVRFFQEALHGSGKVFVGNNDSRVSSFVFGDETVITPGIYEPAYIPFLLDFCVSKNIKLIVSLFDIDLYVLAINKEKFEELGITVLVSDPKVIKICNDKWETNKFLTENRIASPKTFMTLEGAKSALHFPVIIKPRWGMGSIGIYDADNIAELEVLFLKTQKQIEKTYLKYESAQDSDNCVLIQEKISGQEYGLDIINDLNGNYQNTIVKKKYAMRAGETDSAAVVEDSELETLGREIGTTLKHVGNLDVDVIRQKGGQLYVLEMNARFGGGYPFTHYAGVNLPKIIIDWVTGITVSDKRFLPNFNIEFFKDINIVSNQILRGQ